GLNAGVHGSNRRVVKVRVEHDHQFVISHRPSFLWVAATALEAVAERISKYRSLPFSRSRVRAFEACASAAKWRGFMNSPRRDTWANERENARTRERENARTRECAYLLPTVALFAPGVAAHVVAVLLPETGTVAVHELEPAEPLGALPEVQVGHEQAQRPAVLGRDRLAIAHVDQHVLVAQEIVQAQVAGEAVFGVRHDVGRSGTQLDQLHHLGHGHAFPLAVQQGPARHAMNVGLDGATRQ